MVKKMKTESCLKSNTSLDKILNNFSTESYEEMSGKEGQNLENKSH